MNVRLDGDELLCPVCGGNYLHQRAVHVFERDQEDSRDGNHVIVDGATVWADRCMYGNPSGRRQGLFIEFKCELCEAARGESAWEEGTPIPFVLAVSQHKGQTVVQWVPKPTRRTA